MIKFHMKGVSYMAFYQRIRDLREDSDKTQTDLAEYLGTTAQYYGKYEKGERELPFSRAIQLADYYNVSLDYIAGRKNYNGHLTAEEEELICSWRSLSERSRGKVEYLMSELAHQEAKKAGA